MTTCEMMRDRLRAYDISKEIIVILEQKKDFILELNKKQLWDGKTNKNENIHPYYSEDPYFKSKKAALAYARWKEKITPSPKRELDVPNLYINGYFYKSLQIKIEPNIINIDSVNSFGDKILMKYNNITGLNNESRIVFIQDYLRKAIYNSINAKTGAI